MVKVHRVPVLQDNYAWVVENSGDKSCLVIDPGEAGPVLRYLKEQGLRPVAVWNTHHHDDHIAGNEEIREGHLPLVGPDEDRIPGLTQRVKAGDTLSFAGEEVRVLGVPGHTRTHIAFYFPSGHLFSGDLLFGYSCGAVFEGTMEEMYASIAEVELLPDDTNVYCGHEYTLNNPRWASTVEPDNADIKERIARETAPPTVPLNLGQEKRTNPFLRCHLEPARKFTGKTEPAEVFAALRTHKNNFK